MRIRSTTEWMLRGEEIGGMGDGVAAAVLLCLRSLGSGASESKHAFHGPCFLY